MSLGCGVDPGRGQVLGTNAFFMRETVLNGIIATRVGGVHFHGDERDGMAAGRYMGSMKSGCFALQLPARYDESRFLLTV